MDCILLTGNRDSYRSVGSEGIKAFLRVGEMTILERMLIQLNRVTAIRRIYLVGPKDLLTERLAGFCEASLRTPLVLLEQRSDIIENIQFALSHLSEAQGQDEPVLVLPSDLPLLTAEEVSDFLSQCDMSRFDYFGGLATERALLQFYPTFDKPGIVMTYFYFREGSFRINNLHLVRPSAVKKSEYLRKTFSLRYQKKWQNILRMALSLAKLSFKEPASVWYYIGMQWTRLLIENGYPRSGKALRSFFRMNKCERMISKIIGTRFKLVVTHLGGTALDVDNDKDYLAIQSRFDEWMGVIQASISSDIEVKTSLDFGIAP